MRIISIIGFILVSLCVIRKEVSCNSDIRFNTNLESDRDVLIDFKNGIKDPNNQLSSWKGSNYCQWHGINCENETRAIVSIDLRNPYSRWNAYNSWSLMSLSGEIRPSLIKLRSLQYLDLSFNSFDDIPIPQFLGCLKNLQYLNLSCAGFSGAIPSNLGNLSNLQYLDLSSQLPHLFANNLEWMVGLVSLKYLHMNGVDMSMEGFDWVEVLNKLPYLTELHLSDCNLFGSISSPSFINFTSLTIISISYNNFDFEFPQWLLNISSLVFVDVSFNHLYGMIPLGLKELPNLQYLDLSWNRNLRGGLSQLFSKSWRKIEVLNLGRSNLHGWFPNYIGRLCHLQFLSMDGNNLKGSLPKSLEGIQNCGPKTLPNLTILCLSNNQFDGELPEWLSRLENLVELSMSHNKLQGPIPASLGTLQHLTSISLAHNELNGSLPDSFGQLSELSFFDVSCNRLAGSLSEEHFLKLIRLNELHLGSNSFILNVSSNWIPPFQLFELGMNSCNLGPSFPTWLRSQKKVWDLDLSNASISSCIPNWFWDISSNIVRLNLSHNKLQGQLPNPLNVGPAAYIDLSSNLFEGPIPLSNQYLQLLDLSNNFFSGPIPLSIGEFMPYLSFLSLSGNQINGPVPPSIGHMRIAAVIDLSRNSLAGSIPWTLSNCSHLIVLDLGNNNLSGAIPQSFGSLRLLQSLHLRNNKLSGELPFSFCNLSNLETLDLSYNRLSGNIPAWVGAAFMNLRILNLRFNAFTGGLPFELSNLSSLHVLDLAGNHLSRSIPPTFGDLKAMDQEETINKYLLYGRLAGHYYEERLVVSTKGQILEYTKTLSLIVSMDLSNNKLSGEFPKKLTNLRGLVILNLSSNCINGSIPENISGMRQLASLDLSSNNLSGVIPRSMSSLSYLGYLNLSNNNLSGVIPFIGQIATFDASAFYGNPGLCGAPLVTKCEGENQDQGQSTVDQEEENDNGFIDEWFYLSVGLGFAVGTLFPFFILALKRSWCEAYFSFVDKIVNKLGLARRGATNGRNQRG
ncbi:hypothetical protein PVL29_012228 [Vitis rotundifolia]|uniref:Uncharacterized protein n=1 Tax=Vitis rotundifolia TaxID=103349 RepID=A0AA38ZQF1_VITRO|nr:hypothetical protein PVL29_012228 [Vitis rotundifolia]